MPAVLDAEPAGPHFAKKTGRGATLQIDQNDGDDGQEKAEPGDGAVAFAPKDSTCQHHCDDGASGYGGKDYGPCRDCKRGYKSDI